MGQMNRVTLPGGDRLRLDQSQEQSGASEWIGEVAFSWWIINREETANRLLRMCRPRYTSKEVILLANSGGRGPRKLLYMAVRESDLKSA